MSVFHVARTNWYAPRGIAEWHWLGFTNSFNLMATLAKVKVRWQGFSGGPGWSNFFFRADAADGSWDGGAFLAAGRINAFVQNIAPVLPPSVTVQVQNDVEALDEATGQMQHVWTTEPFATHPGTHANTTYSGPSGMVITWRTGGVRNGRRVRGRTFIVPASAGIYESNGTIGATYLTTVQNAANSLLTEPASPDLGVYARPSGAGATDGAWFDITAATVPDMGAILRSRRD